MKRFLQAFRMDMIRGLTSPLFPLTILLTAAIQFLGAWQEIRITPEADVLSLYCIQTMTTTSVAVGALPFATSFCMEWRYRFTPYAAQRSSPVAYCWAMFVSAAVLGGLAVSLGYALVYGALSLRYSLINPETSAFITFSQRAPFGALLRSGRPALFFCALFLLDHALMAAISAGVAMTVSGAAPNLFVALSSPIIYDYININLFSYNKWLSLIGVFDGLRGTSFGGPVYTLLYRIGYAGATLAILGLAFQHLVQRRFANA